MNADLIALSLLGFCVTTVCTATRTHQELAPFADGGYWTRAEGYGLTSTQK